MYRPLVIYKSLKMGYRLMMLTEGSFFYRVNVIVKMIPRYSRFVSRAEMNFADNLRGNGGS